MIVFDPDWLMETGRRDDFRHGLGGWSVHSYLKSVAGGYRGFTGHCSANRRPGPALVPHPDGEPREVLSIARHSDDRLIDEKEGAVWNFPAAQSGRLEMRIRQPRGSAGAQISLVDRWFNPTDPVIAAFSQFILRLDAEGRINGHPALQPEQWHRVSISWNLAQTPPAKFQVDDGDEYPLTQITESLNGISYLHLQSAADAPDPHGLLLEWVEKTARK